MTRPLRPHAGPEHHQGRGSEREKRAPDRPPEAAPTHPNQDHGRDDADQRPAGDQTERRAGAHGLDRCLKPVLDHGPRSPTGAAPPAFRHPPRLRKARCGPGHFLKMAPWPTSATMPRPFPKATPTGSRVSARSPGTVPREDPATATPHGADQWNDATTVKRKGIARPAAVTGARLAGDPLAA